MYRFSDLSVGLHIYKFHYFLMLLSNLLALITFVHFMQTLSSKCLVSNAVFLTQDIEHTTVYNHFFLNSKENEIWFWNLDVKPLIKINYTFSIQHSYRKYTTLCIQKVYNRCIPFVVVIWNAESIQKVYLMRKGIY